MGENLSVLCCQHNNIAKLADQHDRIGLYGRTSVKQQLYLAWRVAIYRWL
jgi:hypothetical protein